MNRVTLGDIQAARFHPLQPYAQRDFAGRMALGLELDGALPDARH